MNLWHDPEKILVTYTKDGETKSFKCEMERLEDLIAWANKEFGDASQPVRSNTHGSTHVFPSKHIDRPARKRKA